MELKIKPDIKNTYPRKGILIRGNNIGIWITEIQQMKLGSGVSLYPLPGITPNSVWGCLVLPGSNKKIEDTGKNIGCQLVGNILYIPEYSVLFPAVSDTELKGLLRNVPHILHPEFGLFELEEKLQMADVIKLPEQSQVNVRKPRKGVFVPKKILSFQVAPIPEEEMLNELREIIGDQRKEFEEEPLSPLENIKLKIYEKLFKGKNNDGTLDLENSAGYRFFDKLSGFISSGKSNLIQNIREEYKKLQERSQSQLDKLMNMLDDDPDEALKYAIPLDEKGSNRGDMIGEFSLTKKNYDFSSFRSLINRDKNKNKSQGPGGSILMADDSYKKLRSRYYNTAERLIAKGEYLKASFVYVKLLQDFQAAASMFEKATMYQEAATIYIELLENKRKAAECYEKGNMLSQAIEIYEELEMNEKVGDLYVQLNNKQKADFFYEKVVTGYIKSHQYVKASLICRNKIGDVSKGQHYLLEGWRKNMDSFNCLNNYFSNIQDEIILGKEINRIYKQEVSELNSEVFLKVIKHEFFKTQNNQIAIKDIAYEIISGILPKNPYIVNELIDFNKKDKHLPKDTLKYKIKGR